MKNIKDNIKKTPVIHSGSGMDIPTKKPTSHSRLKIGLIILLVFFLFFTPFRTNVLIIGIDNSQAGTNIGRSDTMILTSLPPVLPQMTLLSLPRDLWVSLPGGGENRINTAHYFAELNNPGTGVKAAEQVVEMNLGVNVPYTIRIKFDGFIKVVKAMGGVTVNLPEDMAGLTAGKHHLSGKEALAFVRDRAGSDDFARQKRGQLFIKSAIIGMMNPLKWVRIPAITVAIFQAVDTNLPIWLWPRLAYGALFSAVKGFDAHTIDWSMVSSYVTDDGAHVLIPNWELITPYVHQLFN